MQPSHEVTSEEFHKVFSINVESVFVSSNVLVPFFKKQGRGGSVITISSTAGIRPRPKLTWSVFLSHVD
jgi:NAD(P)-dependent dehydrogenase (short-subunit alcohol dehydrogenase family)